MNSPIIPGARLHFPWSEVVKVLNEVRGTKEIRTLYGTRTGPGLWLVGDDGVYLMPNTAAKARAIVYARECDPTKLSIDTWWKNKSASFGDDDGVEFIDIENIDSIAADFLKTNTRPRYFHVDITTEEFTIGVL
jgi:hypothetical protein